MTSSNKKKEIKDSVTKSMRELKALDGGAGNDIPPNEVRPPEETCPIQCLGHLNGTFFFLDINGQFRSLSTSQLSRREEVVSLFGGNIDWLKKNFQHWAKNKKTGELEIVDFDRKNSSDWFTFRCFQGGLFGKEISIKNVGVWKVQGSLLVHCGNEIFFKGRFQKSGIRIENDIFATYPKIQKPSDPCDAQMAFELQRKIHTLWNFKIQKSSMIIIGWLACALLGAAIDWKPALFLIGSAGTGKSTLLRTLLSCCPIHLYTNDATKAGLEQALEGRAIPSFIDEAADNLKDAQVQKIMDMVLAASGKEGANGLRGTAEGKSRSSCVSAPILLASISPPNMQEQHLGRFTLIELLPATKGNDFTKKHEDLQIWCKENARSLWGRVLTSFDRFSQVKDLFRKELSSSGSDGRENDQLSHLLSGWWILTQDGLPDEAGIRRWVGEISEFIKDKEDVSEFSETSSLRDILMSQTIQCARSTDRRSIAKLICQCCFDPKAKEMEIQPDMYETAPAQALESIGIRVIPPYELRNKVNGKPVPRPPDQSGMGIWIWPKNEELKKLLKDTPFSGQRLEYSLKRMPTAYVRKEHLRIGPSIRKNCVWISGKDLQLSLEDLGDENPF